MKKFLLLLLPPGVVILGRKSIHRLRRMRIRKGKSAINDYNDDSLTRMIVEKNRIFSTQLNNNRTIDLGAVRTILGVGIANAKDPAEPLRILDLGGGGGNHYFISRLVMDRHIKLDWRVVETESMARSAAPLANDELQFFPSIRSAAGGVGRFDLVFASSSLQYFSDQFEVLDELMKLDAANIFITRTPFTAGEPVKGAKQYSLLSSNGPGPLPPGYEDKTIEYPIYIMNLADFEKKLTDGYLLRFSIREETAGFTINGKTFDNYGFYFSSKK